LEVQKSQIAGEMMKLLMDSCVFIDSFDLQSDNHSDSLDLLEELLNRKILVTIPAHGWFDVQRTLQKFIVEKRLPGPLFEGQLDYPIELIHIDELFIKNYAMVDIPQISEVDNIFIAVAKKSGFRLVTSDELMAEVARNCEVQVFSPVELSHELMKDPNIPFQHIDLQ
jgi:predicted nucleic acid-binding protein